MTFDPDDWLRERELDEARNTLEIIGGELDPIGSPTTSELSNNALEEFKRLRDLEESLREENQKLKAALALAMSEKVKG